MNNNLLEHDCHCPYCGEPISILLDMSEANQQYIEDCEVCCRPIQVVMFEDGNDEPGVRLLQENEIP